MRNRFRRHGPPAGTLDEVPPGGLARIVRVCGASAVHRRLVDMGLVRGTLVAVVRLAPLGDPMQIRVRGYNLSLRKAEARRIQVEELA